jgi:hypothetical protein
MGSALRGSRARGLGAGGLGVPGLGGTRVSSSLESCSSAMRGGIGESAGSGESSGRRFGDFAEVGADGLVRAGRFELMKSWFVIWSVAIAPVGRSMVAGLSAVGHVCCSTVARLSTVAHVDRSTVAGLSATGHV